MDETVTTGFSTQTHSPLVSIILVTWNSANYLSRCLDSLTQQTLQNFEIILIDNGSTDHALEGIQQSYPSLTIRIELLETNQGFAKANNIGARLACGQWLTLLNTDAFPASHWLENLIQAAKNNPAYSFFSSRQIQANHPDLLDGAGDAYHVSGLAWKRYLGYPANQFGLEQTEVFSACGAAVLYLREAFLEVNGFDEDFFSYMEDVDLGFRLRLRGYRCLYVPDAVVHHIGSATLGIASDFALYHYQRNLIWSFVQNMPPELLWRFLLAHVLANFVYLANYILRGRGRVLWKAKIDAVYGLTKAVQKRREIQSRRSVTERDLLGIMERGWLQPYLLGYQLRRVGAANSQKA
jgi:GT2 family glycosyltransferase